MQTSQLFDEYKREFIQNCDKLEVLSLNNKVDPKGNWLFYVKDYNEFEKLVKSNKLVLKHISVELCSLGSKKAKQVNQVELKPFRDRFRVFEKRLQIINNSRNQAQNHQNNDNQQYNTKMTVKQLEENDKLSECKKLLYQMEDISGQVSSNLKSQTQKMENSKAKLFDTGKYISKANSLIDIMMARERRRQTVACMTLSTVVMIVIGLKYCCY